MRIFGFDSAANLNAENGVRRRVFIYSLSDPRDGKVRYVGKAINCESRLGGHLGDKGFNHKTCWINQLKRLGLKPVVEVVEQVDEPSWQEAEQFWIEQFRQWGFDLTNATKGGEGTLGVPCSEETKRKISIKNQGLRKGIKRTPESIAKSAAGNRGKKRSAEVRALLSEKARSRSPELIEKIASKLRGKKRGKEFSELCSRIFKGRKWTEAQREKQRACRVGKPLSEQNRINIGKALKGRIMGPEWRAKMRAAQLGRKRSPESISKREATKRANREAAARQEVLI